MQDFCFQATGEGLILAALTALGLTTLDAAGNPCPVGDYLYIGVVDGHPGVHAVYRATDDQAAAILAAVLPEGVEIVAPPAGIPLFGGEWLTGLSLAEEQEAAVTRLQAAKWAHMMGKFRDSLGHTYHVDKDSRDLFTGKVSLLGATGKQLPPGFTWKTAEKDAEGNPKYVPHTAETLLALAEEIDAWTLAVFTASEKAQGAVRAATSAAAVAQAEASVIWP